MFVTIVRYLIARLSEASTARGLILLIGGMLGLGLPEAKVNEYAGHLIFALFAMNGLLGVFLPDKIKSPEN